MASREASREAATGRRVVKNTMVLAFGQVIQGVAMGIWTILLARYVGPGMYGVYASAYALMSILTVLAGLGLDQLLTRDVAQHPEQGMRYLITFGVIKGILIGIALIGFGLWTARAQMPADRQIIAVLVAANCATMGMNTLVAALINAHEAMQWAVIAQSANYALTLATGAAAIWLRQGVALVMACSLAASLVQFVMASFYAVRLQRTMGPSGGVPIMAPRDTLKLLWVALPFTMLTLIGTVRTQAPALLLQYLTGSDSAVGQYAAAQRIHAFTVIVPDMLLMALFPAFSSVYARAPRLFAGLFERAYRYVFVVTLPMALALWILAPQLVRLLYGPQYAPAGSALQWLSLSLVGGVGWVMGPAMLAMGLQTPYAAIYVATLGLSAVLGLWAIPTWGPAGAAAALVVGKLVQDTIYSVLLFRRLEAPFPASWMVKTAASTLGMGLLVALLAPTTSLMVVGLLAAPVFYVVCLLSLHTLSVDDRGYLRDLLPERLARRLRLGGGAPEDDAGASP